MRLGWDAVTLESLRDGFRENALDDLARALVRVEATERQATFSTAGLDGPAPPGVPDGGREIEVAITSMPIDDATYRARRGQTFSLLGDASLVAVSCKTGRSPASVRADALKDARGRDGGERVADVLRQGGRLVLLTTQVFTARVPKTAKQGTTARSKKPTTKQPPQSTSGKASLVEELADAYAPRTARTVDVLKEQIAVVDGNDLVEYVKLRKPLLGDDLLKKLGVDDWPAVQDYQGALAELRTHRTLPTYQPDEFRTRLAGQIRALALGAASEEGVLCVVGAPGVGKTRCVLESLRGVAERVLYVVGDATAQHLIEHGGVLRSAPSGILIVDDAMPEAADPLVRAFRRATGADEATGATSSPRLIVIVPAGTYEPETLGRVLVSPLGPLSEQQARALIATALGAEPDDDRASGVFRVTGGYPWFGILVAQEVAEGSAVPATTTGAARLAISPHRNGREEVIQRARALLAAMLARDVVWSGVKDEEREALSRAVDLSSHHELNQMIDRCLARGVLRREEHLYVTPAVLEREVWRILRDDTDPKDPGRGNRRLLDRIREHVPTRAAALVDRLRRVDLTPDELGDLARVTLDSLRAEVTTLDELARRDRSAMLRLCAHEFAEETGSWLGALIANTPQETLRARINLRRLLMNSLDVIARQGAAFDAVEMALFALRLEENETYANNASAGWMLLFAPEFDVTTLPFDRRLPALERRCVHGTSRARVSAIRGLQDLLQGKGVAVTNFGEKPLRRRGPDERQPEREAFCSLLLRCVPDPDALVMETAQRALFSVIVTEGASLAPVLDEPALERVTTSLSEPLRSELRRDVELAMRRNTSTRSALILARLDELTRPGDYAQRLRDRLVRAPFGDLNEGESVGRDDEALVREGLVPPERPLLRHLDVLEEDGAERAVAFAITMGHVDADRLLLTPLVQRARAGTSANVLAAYCFGHHEAGRSALVLGWLTEWKDDPRLASAILLTVARCEGTEPLLRVAFETLQEHEVSPGTLRSFATPRWRDVSDATLQKLLVLLLDRFPSTGASVALRQLQHHLHERDPITLEPLVLEVTERVSTVLAPPYEWPFEQCLRWLVARGRVAEVCGVLIGGLSAEHVQGGTLVRLAIELAASSPGVFWNALRVCLERDDAQMEWALTRLARSEVGALLPARDALTWVDRDVSRAQRAAGLLSLDDDHFPPLAAGLIERFGPTSSPARTLAASLHSTPRGITSLARFYEERRDRARSWAAQGTPAVRAWALKEAGSLEQRRAWHASEEAARRRPTGT